MSVPEHRRAGVLARVGPGVAAAEPSTAVGACASSAARASTPAATRGQRPAGRPAGRRASTSMAARARLTPSAASSTATTTRPTQTRGIGTLTARRSGRGRGGCRPAPARPGRGRRPAARGWRSGPRGRGCASSPTGRGSTSSVCRKRTTNSVAVSAGGVATPASAAASSSSTQQATIPLRTSDAGQRGVVPLAVAAQRLAAGLERRAAGRGRAPAACPGARGRAGARRRRTDHGDEPAARASSRRGRSRSRSQSPRLGVPLARTDARPCRSPRSTTWRRARRGDRSVDESSAGRLADHLLGAGAGRQTSTKATPSAATTTMTVRRCSRSPGHGTEVTVTCSAVTGPAAPVMRPYVESLVQLLLGEVAALDVPHLEHLLADRPALLERRLGDLRRPPRSRCACSAASPPRGRTPRRSSIRSSSASMPSMQRSASSGRDVGRAAGSTRAGCAPSPASSR